MIAGLGHNNGPSMEGGRAWRTHVWRKARADLLPKLPLEVVRLRVKRAKALGLPYKTYAGIRAATGHDLVGFLFSSNALGAYVPGKAVPVPIVEKLVSLEQTKRIGVAHRRIDLTGCAGLDQCTAAPAPHLSWSKMRDHMKAIVVAQGYPADRWVMVGDTMDERDWAVAAQMAGYLPAPVYFAPAAGV